MNDTSNKILHVDMDAFYVSVEEWNNPALKGKPVVVGGRAETRGVVAAANYVSRQFGVHSAMPTARAKRLCPDLIIIAGNHRHYAEVSSQIRAIFHRYTPLVEPLSLDEAFLDVAASKKLFGTAVDIGQRIKHEIKSELGLTASVGVAPNKFLAKIASDLDKPDGFIEVDADNVHAFLDPLPVTRLWGVGKVGNRIFQAQGIRTIAELRQQSSQWLQEAFGSWGETLWQLAHGIDERKVIPDHEAKSISHEVTFPEDIKDMTVLKTCLMELTEQVTRRLRKNRLQGRTVQLKIRFADFKTITRSRTLPQMTNITQEVFRTGTDLLESNLDANSQAVRLIGISVTGFDDTRPVQSNLFDSLSREKEINIDELADRVNIKYGSSALKRGRGLKHNC